MCQGPELGTCVEMESRSGLTMEEVIRVEIDCSIRE